MPARQFDFLAALILVVVCSATVWADEATEVPTSENDVAVVTDTPITPTPDAEVVAREILKLQEEMGGSVVNQFNELEPSRATKPMTRPGWAVAPPRPSKSPVVALRETAWQLDQAAHRLEMLDLYDEADAVRETADKLRHEARVRSERRQKPHGNVTGKGTGSSGEASQ